MQVLEAIRRRRAVRNYQARPVPPESLHKLIEAGSWAPSAMNGQPWHFVVITDKSVLEKIAASARQWALLHEAELGAAPHLQTLLSDAQYDILHRAPALILIAAAVGLRWSVETCAVASENIMLAATELGLGSCWIGLAEGWLNTAEGRALLDLPAGEQVLSCLAIGFPEGKTPPPARRRPVISWIGTASERYVDEQADDYAGLYGSLIHP
jgi:nitroreductase